MRIFLLPISTRRTLIYCEKQVSNSGTQGPLSPPSLFPFPLSSLPDRIVTRASTTWADWERATPGSWKRRLTGYGNRVVLARIPFEEWGLKSLPALHARTMAAAGRAEVVFPGRFVEGGSGAVVRVLGRLSREREMLHKRRLVGSVLAMPLTIPVGLIPVVPNLPFLYLAFRAWSHYKAWYGGKYLAWLLGKGWVVPRGSKVLDELYARGLLNKDRKKVGGKLRVRMEEADVERAAREARERAAKGEEVLLLKARSGQAVAQEFKAPEMELEIERAVEQVQKAIEEAKAAKSSGQERKE